LDRTASPNEKCCEVLNASRFFHCVGGTWRSAEAFGLYLGGSELRHGTTCELERGPQAVDRCHRSHGGPAPRRASRARRFAVRIGREQGAEADGCKACAARACFGETQACELSGGPSSIPQEAQVRRDPGTAGARASSQGKSVRHPKARRKASAL